MRKQLNWIAAGLGVLALVAVPGASTARAAQEQDPEASARVLTQLEAGQARILAVQDALAARMRAQSIALAQKVRAQAAVAAAQSGAVTLQGPEVFDFAGMDGESGWLGVGVDEVTAERAKELKLPAERGVLVTEVQADSPAAKAGLKVNDVITEFNGQRVEGTAQLRRLIRETPSGRTVQLTIWREGRTQERTFLETLDWLRS